MEHTLQNYIVKSFKKLLTDNDLTQNDISIQMDLSRNMVSKYLNERTELTCNMFERFCHAFGVKPVDVISGFQGGIVLGTKKAAFTRLLIIIGNGKGNASEQKNYS